MCVTRAWSLTPVVLNLQHVRSPSPANRRPPAGHRLVPSLSLLKGASPDREKRTVSGYGDSGERVAEIRGRDEGRRELPAAFPLLCEERAVEAVPARAGATLQTRRTSGKTLYFSLMLFFFYVC